MGDRYHERRIIIMVYFYADNGFDLEGNVLSDMNCSFLSASEMQQRFFSIRTDSKKTDQEVVDYYVTGMRAAGICVQDYYIVKKPDRLKLGQTDKCQTRGSNK
jgi:hypothetical protein